MLRGMKSAALAAEVSGASPLFQLLASDDFLVAKRLLFSDPNTLTDMFQFIARKLHEVPRHFKNMTLPAMKALGYSLYYTKVYLVPDWRQTSLVHSILFCHYVFCVLLACLKFLQFCSVLSLRRLSTEWDTTSLHGTVVAEKKCFCLCQLRVFQAPLDIHDLRVPERRVSLLVAMYATRYFCLFVIFPLACPKSQKQPKGPRRVGFFLDFFFMGAFFGFFTHVQFLHERCEEFVILRCCMF